MVIDKDVDEKSKQGSDGRRDSERLRIEHDKKEPQYITPLYYELYTNCLHSLSEDDQKVLDEYIGMNFKSGACKLDNFHARKFFTEKCFKGRNDEKEFTVMLYIYINIFYCNL